MPECPYDIEAVIRAHSAATSGAWVRLADDQYDAIINAALGTLAGAASGETLLKQLDKAEHDLRRAMAQGRKEVVINALSALCAAAAARCMVGVEDIADGPAPVHEYPASVHDDRTPMAGLDGVREAAQDA